MDQKTLVSDEIDGANELICRFDKFASLSAAFWARPANSARWSLYLVSDQIKNANLLSGFGEMVRLAGELHNPDLSLFRASVIPADSPFAIAAIQAFRHYPAGQIIDFGVKLFGDVPVEEAYFYPLPACVPVK